jgi:hypothetical protein
MQIDRSRFIDVNVVFTIEAMPMTLNVMGRVTRDIFRNNTPHGTF